MGICFSLQILLFGTRARKLNFLLSTARKLRVSRAVRGLVGDGCLLAIPAKWAGGLHFLLTSRKGRAKPRMVGTVDGRDPFRMT